MYSILFRYITCHRSDFVIHKHTITHYTSRQGTKCWPFYYSIQFEILLRLFKAFALTYGKEAFHWKIFGRLAATVYVYIMYIHIYIYVCVCVLYTHKRYLTGESWVSIVNNASLEKWLLFDETHCSISYHSFLSSFVWGIGFGFWSGTWQCH